MAIEHADFEGIEQLALVLGGEIVSTFFSPEKVKLGSCDLIEEVMIGEDRVREEWVWSGMTYNYGFLLIAVEIFRCGSGGGMYDHY